MERLKKKTGRPTSLTPAVQEKIIKHVRAGAYISTACLAAGVTRASFYNWEGRAQKGQQPYAGFFDAVRQVEAQAEIKATTKMRRGKEFFLPEATFLDRRFRDRWGRSDRIALDGAGLGPISLRVHLNGGRQINIEAPRNTPRLVNPTPPALPPSEAPRDGGD